MTVSPHDPKPRCKIILIPETSHRDLPFIVSSDKLTLHIVRYRWYKTNQFTSDPLLMNEAKIFEGESVRLLWLMGLWWISAARNDRRLRSAISFLAVHLDYFRGSWRATTTWKAAFSQFEFISVITFEVKLVFWGLLSKLNFENNIKLDLDESRLKLSAETYCWILH